MNPITSIEQLTNETNALPQASQAGSAEQKEDFLKLLVTQLRHQDPLSPLDGSEFASQLAQFSSLEELQNLGTKLDNALQSDMILAQSINNTMASTMIGREVKAADDSVHLVDNTGTDVQFDLRGFTSMVKVDIYYPDGRVLRTIEVPNLGAGEQAVHWDGRDTLGNLVPQDDYRVSVKGVTRSGSEYPIQPLTIGRVDGVNFVEGNPVLMVNGREVPYGNILSIMSGETAEDEGNILQRIVRGLR